MGQGRFQVSPQDAQRRRSLRESLREGWEPGTLPRPTLERILMDSLTDLWKFQTEERKDFTRVVESALYSATGLDLQITERR